MNSLDLNEVTQYVDANIGTFHAAKLKSIK